MVDRGRQNDLGAGGAQLLELQDQMFQLGHTAAAHLDQKRVGTGDVIALQHFFAVLQQFQKGVLLGGCYRQTDEGIHIHAVGRAVQGDGVAADDAVGLQLVNAAGHGGAGQRYLFGDLLDRHPGIFGEQGMISVIATALAVATGSLYPLFAPVIGCLGTFITGSDTSSNILFGKLQANVAGHIQVSPDWLSAANTVGATGGKIISPQSIAIATSAGNQQGKEGEILKSAIPYALAYVVITGVIVYIFS